MPGDQRTSYERPSVARDALGRIWISAIGVKGNVKTIFLYVIESANTPRRVNRRFGLSNRYHQRSARLLQVRGGVMMVFSDDPAKNNQEYTLNFTQRLDTQPLGAAWTPAKQILHYHNEPDDNGAHFSCAVDSLGAVHIVTRSYQTMSYLKLANGNLAARTPRDLKLAGPQHTHRQPSANRTPCIFFVRLNKIAGKSCIYFRAPMAESPFRMTTT